MRRCLNTGLTDNAGIEGRLIAAAADHTAIIYDAAAATDHGTTSAIGWCIGLSGILWGVGSRCTPTLQCRIGNRTGAKRIVSRLVLGVSRSRRAHADDHDAAKQRDPQRTVGKAGSTGMATPHASGSGLRPVRHHRHPIFCRLVRHRDSQLPAIAGMQKETMSASHQNVAAIRRNYDESVNKLND